MSPQERSGELPPVGRALAAAREASGRTTADVAAELRLREAVVVGIERDDYTLCGGTFYARGHVRAYARLLGLEHEALAHGYPNALRDPAGDIGPGAAARRGPVAPLQAMPGMRRLERPAPPWSVLAGAALVALVLLTGGQLLGEVRGPARPAQELAAPARTTAAGASASPSRGSSAASARPATLPATLPATPPATVPAATRPTAKRPTKPPPEGVALRLRATGSSWVAVRRASGRTMFSGLLGKGDSKHFTDADGLRVVLGNAGGVQLTVNGRKVGAAGRDGEVKRLTIRP